jgi:hypothetical protein
MARPEPGEGDSRLIVLSEDMVEVEAIRLLQLSNVLLVCSHAVVVIV